MYVTTVCTGISDLRCGRNGYPLPSARAVSAALFGPDVTKTSPVHTVMHMSFGQFLAHDNERTAVTKLSKNDDGKKRKPKSVSGTTKQACGGVR